MSRKPIPDLSRSEISHLIDEWIFNERDRQIVKRRLLDGICFGLCGNCKGSQDTL